MLSSRGPILVLDNEGPELEKIGTGRSRMFLAYLVALTGALIFVILAVGPTTASFGVAFGVFLVALVLYVYSRRNSRIDRRFIPRTLEIYDDRLDGIFGNPGPKGITNERLSIPFGAIAGMWPAGNYGGRERFWKPAIVLADYSRIVKFDPSSVRSLLRGPPAPFGCADRFILATRNFEPVKSVYLRSCPGSQLAPEGGLISPNR